MDNHFLTYFYILRCLYLFHMLKKNTHLLPAFNNPFTTHCTRYQSLGIARVVGEMLICPAQSFPFVDVNGLKRFLMWRPEVVSPRFRLKFVKIVWSAE